MKEQPMNWWWFILCLLAIGSTPMTALFWLAGREGRKRRKKEARLGAGMAKKRGTWDIEYGDRPNPSHWKGYDSTTTARLIAESHDEAVALLKEYDPDFNPQYIVKSERGGIEYIIAGEKP